MREESGRFFFIYRPTASLKEIILVGAIDMCPVVRNTSLSLTNVTQPAYFLSYSSSFQLSLRWLAGLGAPGFFRTHRDCHLYLFLLLLYIELLVHGYSVQTSF